MPKKKAEEIEDLLRLAKKRAKKAIDADKHNRAEAIDDLKFKQGLNQWDEGEKRRRKDHGRPCLQINVLPKYSAQVCGELRRNKVRIKVRPTSAKGNLTVAKLREGLIYNIEYASSAESIYDYAGKMLVDCGYGAWRILTRYTESNPFLQEIYMERILNPFNVYFDPETKDQNFADAKWAFVFSKMSKKEFEEEYPGVELPGNTGIGIAQMVGSSDEYWYDADTVTVADYFYTEYEKKKMVKLSDGQILEKEEADKIIEGWQKTLEDIKASQAPGGDLQPIDDTQIPTIVEEREIKKPKIKWAKITGDDVLEEQDWPGKYIPIVLVTGEEVNIEGKRYINGLIRNAKDPQRMLNFWHTSAAETVALAPKAPWIATAAMIDGYEGDYSTANEENMPVMLYNIDPAAPGVKPERLGAGQVPQAIFSEIQRAEQNIKSCIGMFNSDVGDQGRELSGKAIFARQLPGDTATYIYPDNLQKAIAHGGKIINDLIPHIYDTKRDARLRAIDDTESFAPINSTAGDVLASVNSSPGIYSGVDKKDLMETISKKGVLGKYNDITEGDYDVVITTGPAYQTQRVEAAENMLKLITAARQVHPLDKYYLAKNIDFPGSDSTEYVEALRKMVPPNLLPPKEGEKPQPQAPPPPQAQVLMLKMQTEQAKMKTEQARQQVSLARLMNETKETDREIRQTILKILSELHSPQPAEANMIQQGGLQ